MNSQGCCARGKIGDSCCTRDPVYDLQDTDRTLVNPDRRHSDGGLAKACDLALQLVRISPRQTRRWQPQFGRIRQRGNMPPSQYPIRPLGSLEFCSQAYCSNRPPDQDRYRRGPRRLGYLPENERKRTRRSPSSARPHDEAETGSKLAVEQVEKCIRGI